LALFLGGGVSLGGGFWVVPLVGRGVVGNKGWIEEEEMVDVVALSQSIPGGIAINASTIVGYKVGGVLGSLSAIVGVALPSFISITLIAMLLNKIGDLSIVEAAFKGVRATVVALIAMAAYNFSKTVIRDYGAFIIFIISLALLFWGKISAIWVIVIGAIIGCALSKTMEKKEGAQR